MEVTTLTVLILLFLISVFIYTTWDKKYRNYNLPPGPMPLPIIGNLLNIERGRLVKSLNQLKDKYGPIYTLYFGSRPVVILCGYQLVKEALVDHGEDFNNRGHIPALDRFYKAQGVLMSNGERWKQLRRFTLATLRSFGMGKKDIEEKIQEEAQLLIEELRKYKQSPVNPTDIITQAVSNLTCSLMLGNRFEYGNASFLSLIRMCNEIFQLIGSTWGQMQEMMPELMNHLPGPHQKMNTLLHKLLDIASEIAKSKQETLHPSNPRDCIDSFLIKLNQESKQPGTEFYDKNVLYSVLQLIFAGTVTVSATIRHGLLILVCYPEIQDKVYEEIKNVIGDSRNPNIGDRSKLPYTDAVVHEIQRFSDVVPLNLTHAAIKDVKFQGYTIPKGTDVYPLLYCTLRDPAYFKTPDKFNPEHFLDENGAFKTEDAFIPFSAGKRICVGEGLAKTELFLFLTTILQNFKLTSKRSFTDADIGPRMAGFSNVPAEYEISFVPR